MFLRREIIKRTPIFPADHVGPLDRAFDFVAALFLKDLAERFQLGNVFRPTPFGAAESVFEFAAETLDVEVVGSEIVNGVVALAAKPDIVQIRIHRTGNV